jgi:hypothetical protein
VAERVSSLLGDSVSPLVTFERVSLLIERALPHIARCEIALCREDQDQARDSGEAARPDAAVIAAPLRDDEVHGEVRLHLTAGQPARADDAALADWLGRALAPIARIALRRHIPANWRP